MQIYMVVDVLEVDTVSFKTIQHVNRSKDVSYGQLYPVPCDWRGVELIVVCAECPKQLIVEDAEQGELYEVEDDQHSPLAKQMPQRNGEIYGD